MLVYVCRKWHFFFLASVCNAICYSASGSFAWVNLAFQTVCQMQSFCRCILIHPLLRLRENISCFLGSACDFTHLSQQDEHWGQITALFLSLQLGIKHTLIISFNSIIECSTCFYNLPSFPYDFIFSPLLKAKLVP